MARCVLVVPDSLWYSDWALYLVRLRPLLLVFFLLPLIQLIPQVPGRGLMDVRGLLR